MKHYTRSLRGRIPVVILMGDNCGMATSYLPYQPGQSHLLPPSAEDWLPEGHLAYFIADTVEQVARVRPKAAPGNLRRG